MRGHASKIGLTPSVVDLQRALRQRDLEERSPQAPDDHEVVHTEGFTASPGAFHRLDPARGAFTVQLPAIDGRWIGLRGSMMLANVGPSTNAVTVAAAPGQQIAATDLTPNPPLNYLVKTERLDRTYSLSGAYCCGWFAPVSPTVWRRVA